MEPNIEETESDANKIKHEMEWKKKTISKGREEKLYLSQLISVW